jgi:phage-related protein
MAETLEFPDHLLGTSSETYEPMQLDETPKIQEAVFGDGYSQRSADGINNIKQVWRLSFTRRSGADVDGIYDFLRARGGVEHFLWTPRGEASPRKFICKTWRRSYDHYDVVQGITFSLEEVFEA